MLPKLAHADRKAQMPPDVKEHLSVEVVVKILQGERFPDNTLIQDVPFGWNRQVVCAPAT
jgi:hypothetical protein